MQKSCIHYHVLKIDILQDIKAIKEQINACMDVYNQAFFNDLQTSAQLMQRILASLTNQEGVTLIVVRHAKKIIGFIYGFDFKERNWFAQQIHGLLPARIPHEPETFTWYDACFELNELCVLPTWQGYGIGKKLLATLEAMPQYRTIVLATAASNNARVLNFYAGLKYKIVPYEWQLGERSYKVLYKRLH